MKNLIVAVGGALLGVAGVAFAQTNLPSADQAFADQAAMSGLAEIAEANIALNNSMNDKITDFAHAMIADHGKAALALQKAAQAQGLQLPKTPSQKQQTEAAALQGLTGPKFDKVYVEDQIAAHKEAVALFERESQSGQNPQLKQFAAATLPTLQHHLQMAQSLNSP